MRHEILTRVFPRDGAPPAWWEVAAPPFFVVCVLVRSWLEMTVFSATDRFSYYTALHHLSWYASTMLAILFVVHLVLRVPFRWMIPLLYGIVVAVVPLIWSAATGQPLRLEYLVGTPGRILAQIATVSISAPRNWPLVPEVVLIVLGIVGVAWLLTGRWLRSLAAGAATYLTLAVCGLPWFGLERARRTVFSVASDLSRPQSLQAAAWVTVASVLVLVALWRLGVFRSGERSWIVAAVAGGEAWLLWAGAMLLLGRFRQPFDLLVTGLPMATAAFILVRLLRRDRRAVAPGAWMMLVLVLAVQLAALLPFIAGFEDRFYRERRWRRGDPPRLSRPTAPGGAVAGRTTTDRIG